MATYEEDRWEYLSPRFREAHNTLRAARGLPPIPPPAVDRYVPPQRQTVTLADPDDPEIKAEIKANALQLFGPSGIRFGRGDEGFSDEQAARRAVEPDEGWR